MIHILIADNATARLFQATDGNEPMTEVYDFVNPSAHLHERDLVSSRPGRVVNRMGGVHQSFDPETSARSHALSAWVHSLKKSLTSLLRQRGGKSLIVVASPRLLSAIKKELRGHVEIRGELARNLCGMPTPLLNERLRPLVRAATAGRPEFRQRYPSLSFRASKSRTSASPV